MPLSIGVGGKVDVEEFGVTGPFNRPKINFIQGGATSISVADDVGNDKVNVTISSTDTAGISSVNSTSGLFALSLGTINLGTNFSTAFAQVYLAVYTNSAAAGANGQLSFGYWASNGSTAAVGIDGAWATPVGTKGWSGSGVVITHGIPVSNSEVFQKTATNQISVNSGTPSGTGIYLNMGY